jgi:dihydroneopterin aldolase
MRAPEQRIFIKDFEVRCSIGVHPAEREGPQRVRVNIVLDVRPGDGADDIARVLDYDFVRDGVARIAHSRHFNLQETLCEEIAQLCLSREEVLGVRVRTEKPDVYADCESVGVEIARFKE